MTSPRLAPPFWRHDAYALRQLARGLSGLVAGQASRLQQAGRRVVDLGAGEAPYRSLFAGLGAEYLCCDIDRHAQVPITPGEPVPLADGIADLVVSFQVLEHVWDLDWYLGQAHRLLKPDGALILSTHGTWPYHPHPTDFRRWTRDGLVAELQTRGFVIRQVHALVGPLAWTTQFRTLGYHALLSRVPGIGAWLSGLVCALMHLRMRIEDAITPRHWIDHNAAIYLVLAQPTPPEQAPAC